MKLSIQTRLGRKEVKAYPAKDLFVHRVLGLDDYGDLTLPGMSWAVSHKEGLSIGPQFPTRTAAKKFALALQIEKEYGKAILTVQVNNLMWV